MDSIHIELDERIKTLEAQRNNALNEVVLLRGLLAVRDQEIAELKANEPKQ